MLRVVLDPNVIVSALISPASVPAQVVEAILDADLDHIASPRWLAEADELATRPRFRRWFAQRDAEALVERLWLVAEIVSDPQPGPSYSRDPDDDYLIAVARGAHADAVVSGDHDLLILPDHEVVTPRQMLDQLG